jgi:hypothetical protein
MVKEADMGKPGSAPSGETGEWARSVQECKAFCADVSKTAEQ